MRVMVIFQAQPKFSQIQQNPAKPEPNLSKETPLISLDSLGGIEPFQWVVATPRGKKLFSRSFPGHWPARTGAPD
jgi:hypothetical protein